MKRFKFLVAIVVIAIASFVFVGCGEPSIFADYLENDFWESQVDNGDGTITYKISVNKGIEVVTDEGKLVGLFYKETDEYITIIQGLTVLGYKFFSDANVDDYITSKQKTIKKDKIVSFESFEVPDVTITIPRNFPNHIV